MAHLAHFVINVSRRHAHASAEPHMCEERELSSFPLLLDIGKLLGGLSFSRPVPYRIHWKMSDVSVEGQLRLVKLNWSRHVSCLLMSRGSCLAIKKVVRQI
jgi:hypothetical protein